MMVPTRRPRLLLFGYCSLAVIVVGVSGKGHDLSLNCDVRYNVCLQQKEDEPAAVAAMVKQRIVTALEAHEAEMDTLAAAALTEEVSAAVAAANSGTEKEDAPTETKHKSYWVFDSKQGFWYLTDADESRAKRGQSTKEHNAAKKRLRLLHEQQQELDMNGDPVPLPEPELVSFASATPSGRERTARDFCVSYTTLPVVLQRYFPIDDEEEEEEENDDEETRISSATVLKECGLESTLCSLRHPCTRH